LVDQVTHGAMKINGSAGTGKTVALVHRAARLARQLEDPRSRVLVTTFSTTLAPTIRDLLKRLDRGVEDRIEVTSLHSLARTICRRSGWDGHVADDAEMQEAWDAAWQEMGSNQPPATREEMEEEYRTVIDPAGIDSEEG